jgi:peptidoglycan-N-acetylglucosamine deacetylase
MHPALVPLELTFKDGEVCMKIKTAYGNFRILARAISVLLLVLAPCMGHTQVKSPWNNKSCAVSLTYDDALNVDLDNVIPLLDSVGLKGTFYVSASFPALQTRTAEWKAAAAKGHELGNHSLFHPCDGKKPGRDWIKPEYDLSTYSLQRMTDEIRINNFLISLMDNKYSRTFAYPCGDTRAGGASYVPNISHEFAGARAVAGKMQRIDEIDLMDIGSYMINGQSGDDLIALVKQALGEKALLVFLFHGVGGEHNLNVSLDAHGKLVHFLKENEKDIWIAPLVNIAEYVRQQVKK